MNATQPTSADQPTVMANQINGLPAVSFDGTNDSLSLPTNAAFSNLTQGASMFIVTNPVSTGRMLWYGVTGTTNDEVMFYQATSTSLRFGVLNGATASTVSGANALGSYQVIDSIYNGSNIASLYQNGSLLAQSTTMQTALNLSRFCHDRQGRCWYSAPLSRQHRRDYCVQHCIIG